MLLAVTGNLRDLFYTQRPTGPTESLHSLARHFYLFIFIDISIHLTVIEKYNRVNNFVER